jgi:hypothetical protein
VTGTCSICDSPRHTVVNAFLAAGRSAGFIEKEMRVLGSPTKAETVLRHLSRCLNNNRTNATIDVTAAGVSGDFALAVRAEAARLLAAGEMRVRAEHGLSAQALLDRRAEHAANRTLLLNITRLLSGGTQTPPEMIVGEWRELAPDARVELLTG